MPGGPMPPGGGPTGGVTLMAYDQRFANNEVKMGLTFPDGEMKLVSFNGEKEHVSDLPLPQSAGRGRRWSLRRASSCSRAQVS